jgi:hypothetical protein
MDARGVVTVERSSDADPLFATQQRRRLDALARFAAAGFRVRMA